MLKFADSENHLTLCSKFWNTQIGQTVWKIGLFIFQKGFSLRGNTEEAMKNGEPWETGNIGKLYPISIPWVQDGIFHVIFKQNLKKKIRIENIFSLRQVYIATFFHKLRKLKLWLFVFRNCSPALYWSLAVTKSCILLFSFPLKMFDSF